jgi:energy-coupling factor transport system permease protein
MTLGRLHPLTPIAAAAALVALAYAGPAPWSPVAALALALAAAAPFGLARRALALAAAVALPTWLLLALMDGLLAPGARVVFAGPLRVSLDGLDAATAIALRLAAAVAALGAVILGVSPRRLARALAERGWPAWSAYLLVASLDAVPQARRRAREVIEAQRARGIGPGRGVAGRLRALLPLAAPLAVGLVVEAEERALALDARAFRPRARRATLDPVADSVRERRLRLALWAAAVALLAWGLAR